MNQFFKTTVDFQFLIKNKLSPNEYIYLYLTYYKLNRFLHEMFDNDMMDQEMELSLESKGFIEVYYHKDSGATTGVELRSKAKSLFEETDLEAKWLEFFTTYPLKVNDMQGGMRVLRPGKHDSKQALEYQKLYTSIIKKEVGSHDKIMKGLHTYLTMNKNKLTFLVSFDKFLKENMWEMYEDIEAEQSTERTIGI